MTVVPVATRRRTLAAKRLLPQSFHRIVNAGCPLFNHLFAATDPRVFLTPAGATPERRLTRLGGYRIGNVKIVDRRNWRAGG
jgi:hypothetical protein